MSPFNWDKVFTVSRNTVNKKLRQRVWKRFQLAIECHPLGEYSKSQRFFHFQLNKLIIKRQVLHIVGVSFSNRYSTTYLDDMAFPPTGELVEGGGGLFLPSGD